MNGKLLFFFSKIFMNKELIYSIGLIQKSMFSSRAADEWHLIKSIRGFIHTPINI